jgi:adenosine deaminase CECR1
VIGILKRVLDDFKQKNPDFLGMKVIYSTYRRVKPMALKQKIEKYTKYRETHPDFVVGFDIVGQEDMGEPLIQFIQQMQGIADKGKFFFHAGETSEYN